MKSLLVDFLLKVKMKRNLNTVLRENQSGGKMLLPKRHRRFRSRAN